MGKKIYVTRMMKAKCTCGSMSNYLNLPKDHGIIQADNDHPLMNANDHIADENIVHFGRCSSKMNPENIANGIASFVAPGLSLINSVKKLVGCEGCKCRPKTVLPWVITNDDYIIDGAPVLTKDSTLPCFYGGIISIDTEGIKCDDTEELSDEEFIKMMEDTYGFSSEEAKMIKQAYDNFQNSDENKDLSRQEKMDKFFSNMAALLPEYSGDDMKFKLAGSNPSEAEAIKFFENLGINVKGENGLQQAIVNQHKNCSEMQKRDFAHEVAMYSVFANDSAVKIGGSLVEDIDYLVGFKGDIYSGSMGQDDIRSDIAAVNIYNRMLTSNSDNILNTMARYNIAESRGEINSSKEFLLKFGGTVQDGYKNLQKEVDAEGIGSYYIKYGTKQVKDAYIINSYSNSYMPITNSDLFKKELERIEKENEIIENGVKDAKENFYNHLEKEANLK